MPVVGSGTSTSRLSRSTLTTRSGSDRVEQHALPPDWQHQPSHPTLREIGDTWVTNRASVAMLVPSAVIPLEFNALLNPAHPDFASMTVSDAVEFKFDRRLAALVSV